MVKYCYPNLPNWIDAKTVDNYKPYYIAEKKKNGWRCLAWRKKEGLELWTRRNTLIKDPLPKTRLPVWPVKVLRSDAGFSPRGTTVNQKKGAPPDESGKRANF